MMRFARFSRFHVPRVALVHPIIIKEMRGQMRGSRAFWILTGYLLGLGLLVYFLYRISTANTGGGFGPGGLPQSAYVGQSLFIGLSFLELIFISMITPALTAGAISGEVERRTFDMLMATPLRPISVLWGKLIASLSYIQLLILAAIPLFSIVFLFGGMVLRDAIQALGLMVIVAATYGTMGLFFSALTRRTGRAVAFSYLVVLLLIFGTGFGYIVTGALSGGLPSTQMLYLNPISALTSAILTPQGMESVYRMGPIVSLLVEVSGAREVLGLSAPVTATRPLWQYTVALYVAMTLVFYLLTTQLVKPVRRWRIGWLGLVGAVLTLVLVAAGLLFVFGTSSGSTGWSGRVITRGMIEPGFAPVPAVQVVEEVVVGPVVAVDDSPMPTPAPTPTPFAPPTPVPFVAEEYTAMAQQYLERSLLPGAQNTFCDLMVLESGSGPELAYIFGWVYCRAFEVADGELQPGMGISAPLRVNLGWKPEEGWQVGSTELVDPRMLDQYPLAQKTLAETPYDHAAGEERVQERAREALLEE